MCTYIFRISYRLASEKVILELVKNKCISRLLHGLERGYWYQRADETFGDPPPRWIEELFGDQRQG